MQQYINYESDIIRVLTLSSTTDSADYSSIDEPANEFVTVIVVKNHYKLCLVQEYFVTNLILGYKIC